jgi:hypothetical protein
MANGKWHSGGGNSRGWLLTEEHRSNYPIALPFAICHWP